MASGIPRLSIDSLIEEARRFSSTMSRAHHESIVGATDGKKIGTYIELKFKETIGPKYSVTIGNAAEGIDFPDPHINTDMKTTFITQPQSSCPFRNARQKIFGLGYNLLLFVYEKDDKKTNNLNFLHVRFIDKSRTADYTTTKRLNEILKDDGNEEDIVAYLSDRNLPVDEIEIAKIAKEVIGNPPAIGYLTISNALQWRLQYGRVITLDKDVKGIVKIYDYE
jgi:hypothetical protein